MIFWWYCLICDLVKVFSSEGNNLNSLSQIQAFQSEFPIDLFLLFGSIFVVTVLSPLLSNSTGFVSAMVAAYIDLRLRSVFVEMFSFQEFSKVYIEGCHNAILHYTFGQRIMLSVQENCSHYSTVRIFKSS